MSVLLSPLQNRRMFRVGRYQITDIVDRLGVPGSYLVRLYDRSSGQLLAQTHSAADGTYLFDGLEHLPDGYFTLAHDGPADPHNAGIADLLTPEPM